MQIRITGTEDECETIANLLEKHFCEAKTISEFYPNRRKVKKSVEGRVYITFDDISPNLGKYIRETKKNKA